MKALSKDNIKSTTTKVGIVGGILMTAADIVTTGGIFTLAALVKGLIVATLGFFAGDAQPTTPPAEPEKNQ